MPDGTGAPRTVLCMKWGERYPADYVNRLRAMVARNLSGPYRFVCLTDDARGIDGGVECLPIPEVGEGDGPERGWRKLGCLAAPLHDLAGTALYLDLDVVLLRPIDDLFTFPGAFPMAHDRRLADRRISNSSVFRFTVGAHGDVLDAFRADPRGLAAAYRNEQAYLSARVRAQGQLVEWPADWCVSFKYDCLPNWPLNFVAPATRPAEARVVFFHGHPKPHEAAQGYADIRRFTRPVPWVVENWR